MLDTVAGVRVRVGDDTIKVLIIEDNPIDAELFQQGLRRGGVAVDCMVAADEAELREVLLRFVPDVVLCDFSLPGFDGFAAQRIVRAVNANVPLIFVSGTISEESAAKAIQTGAVDYVMKTSLARLPSAVQRAVLSSRVIADAEERARQHAVRLETLWCIANNPTLRGQELILVMLQQAAAAIAPPQRFRGLLCRVDGNDIAVIGAQGASDGGDDPDPTFLQLGACMALENTRETHRHGWDDALTSADVPPGLADLGWRATICAQFETGGSRYWLAFASAEPTTTPFSDADFAYLDVLATSFANQVQVNGLEQQLRDEEERSRQHAQRLEALLQVVNDPTLGDAEKWLAMLDQAVTSLGPGQGYRGMLWRVHGTEMTLQAVAHSHGHVLSGHVPQIGEVVALSSTIVGNVLADGGGTRSWDDIEDSPYSADYARKQGTRSLVITTFIAGGATWALTFSSGRPTSIPLGQQEHAYIEVIASFFSKHAQQRWQFERIQYQQSHDVLTGLLNRSQFRSQARAGARTSSRYAIVVVDINAFHEINEAYGHTVADALLVEVGNALGGCASADEIVGRVGGDVFAIYIPNPLSHEHLRDRARDFAGVFARSFSTGGSEGQEFIARTASIGVAVAPEDGQIIDAVHSHADAALAAAKQRGHGSIVFYEAGMERDAQRRAALRNELVEACEKDQLALYYQPHIDMRTGEATGCEALLRWNHPQRGLLGPDDFIPFAEQTGIITSIDAWVMRKAFAVAGELSESRPGFRLYFNVSGRTAGDPKLVRAFIDAARSGVSLANVGLEITETDVMRDVERTRRVFRALRRLDVRVAIDDFGTGYSSLSSLKRLPVDIVKIDRSFISGITSNFDDAAIADTIISIAEHFGFESMGEGAENPADVEWLRRHGCRYVQGYAVCHPLPLGAFKAWLAARRPRALNPSRSRRVEASSAGSRRLMPA
jgi:diguanylate cyclase (GGDEF)-like protein